MGAIFIRNKYNHYPKSFNRGRRMQTYLCTVCTYVQPERLSPVLEALHWTTTVRCNRWFSASLTDLKCKGSRSLVLGNLLNFFQTPEAVSAVRYFERTHRLYSRSRSIQLQMLRSTNHLIRITSFTSPFFHFCFFYSLSFLFDIHLCTHTCTWVVEFSKDVYNIGSTSPSIYSRDVFINIKCKFSNSVTVPWIDFRFEKSDLRDDSIRQLITNKFANETRQRYFYIIFTVTMEIQFDRTLLVYYFVRCKVPVVVQPIALLDFPTQFANTSRYVDTKVSVDSNILFSYGVSCRVVIIYYTTLRYIVRLYCIALYVNLFYMYTIRITLGI